MAKKSTTHPKDQADVPSMSDIFEEALMALRAKDSKKKDGSGFDMGRFMSLDDIPEDTPLPLRAFTMQYAFGRTALKPGTVIEMIGPEHVGKTTLLMTLFGDFMTACPNIPALYVCTEGRNKLLDSQRIKTCLHEDPAIANKFYKQIIMMEGTALIDTLEGVNEWIKVQRELMTKNGIPETTPILVGIDTLSKLMPKTEASKQGYGKDKGNEGSNLEFSNYMQKWSRAAVDVTEKCNALIILVSHQNEKIEMVPMGRPMVSASDNKTKIGGRAVNQTAVTQFTLVRVGSKTNAATKEVLSHYIKLKVVKNSKGADSRFIVYELRIADLKHEPGKYERAINFDFGIAELFALKKILATRGITSEKFTCKALDLSEASRQVFADKFLSNPDMVNSIGTELGIYGYDPKEIDPIIVETNQSLAAGDVEAYETEDGSSVSFAEAMDEEDGPGEEEPTETTVKPVKKRGRKPKSNLDDTTDL